MAIDATLHGTWTSAVHWDKFHPLETSSAENNIGAYQLKSQETCQITEGVETVAQNDLGHEAGCSSSAATVLATAVPIRGFGGAGLQTKQAVTSTPSRASGSTSIHRHNFKNFRRAGKQSETRFEKFRRASVRGTSPMQTRAKHWRTDETASRLKF